MEFNDFLQVVDSQHQDFAIQVNKYFIDAKCKMKMESKASGYVVSYAHPKTKRSLLNFVFRKNGLFVRMYPQNFDNNISFNNLPKSMTMEINKAPGCKDCSSKCQGFAFSIQNDKHYLCRYSFMFIVTEESKPILTDWVKTSLV